MDGIGTPLRGVIFIQSGPRRVGSTLTSRILGGRGDVALQAASLLPVNLSSFQVGRRRVVCNG
jgi:hypothetical protein